MPILRNKELRGFGDRSAKTVIREAKIELNDRKRFSRAGLRFGLGARWPSHERVHHMFAVP